MMTINLLIVRTIQNTLTSQMYQPKISRNLSKYFDYSRKIYKLNNCTLYMLLLLETNNNDDKKIIKQVVFI